MRLRFGVNVIVLMLIVNFVSGGFEPTITFLFPSPISTKLTLYLQFGVNVVSMSFLFFLNDI